MHDRLIVCGEVVAVDWIRDEFDMHRSQLSDYQQLVLHFCQRWLRGDGAFEIHTSGSTGKPKPIVLSRAQMVASAKATAKATGLVAGDHLLACLDVRYIGGMMMIVRALVLDLQLTIIDPVARPLAAFTNSDDRFDLVAMVPMQVAATLQHDSDQLMRCRIVLIGGAAMPADLEKRLINQNDQKVRFYHTYGMTETVSHIALRPIGGSDWFDALPDVTLSLDERGCLIICGATTAFSPVTTNDIVSLKQQRFIWLGRADNVINSGGVKVTAEKVERALATVVGTRRLFVRGVADVLLGERIVAFIEGDVIDDDLLIDKIRPLLAKYELPKEIYFVNDFCETGSGKIDAQATMHIVDRSDGW